MYESKEVSNQQIFTGFTELKEVFTPGKLNVKFIDKCKDAILKNEKLNASEKQFCDDVLLKHDETKTIKKPLE